MSLLGNIIWIVFGGFWIALEYIVGGLLMCLTIVGIPFGYGLIKIGLFALMPFGSKCVYDNKSEYGCLNSILNILWVFSGGIIISLTHLAFGLLFCLTIVGIPFGMQHFKLMSLAFTPFGRDIISS